jgi:hypothetical protein
VSGSLGGLRLEDGLQPAEVGLVPASDDASCQGLEQPEDAAQLDLVGEGDQVPPASLSKV